MTTFSSMFMAIAQIFVIMFVAGTLLKKKIITDDLVSALSVITVTLLLPCLSFSKIVIGFDPSVNKLWWTIPLLGTVILFLGMGVAWVVFRGRLKSRRYLLALSAIQNCTFFVLPIGKIVYADQFDEFALYVFLLALFVNPILWSLGKVLVSDSSEISLKKFITPPFVANVVALLFVFTGMNKYIPQFVLGPVELMGTAAVPIATFILGATLGSVSLAGLPKMSELARMTLVKFIAIPLITIAFLNYFDFKTSNPLLADFFIIESAAAPATGLVIMVRRYGGNESRVGSMMLISYLICLFAVPLWLALWKVI